MQYVVKVSGAEGGPNPALALRRSVASPATSAIFCEHNLSPSRWIAIGRQLSRNR